MNINRKKQQCKYKIRKEIKRERDARENINITVPTLYQQHGPSAAVWVSEAGQRWEEEPSSEVLAQAADVLAAAGAGDREVAGTDEAGGLVAEAGGESDAVEAVAVPQEAGV